MIERKAYAIQMSFEVPDSEKRLAEKAEERFEELLSTMKVAIEYLDLIYGPFKKHDNLDMKLIMHYRKTFRQYRDAVKRRYDKIIKMAFKCVMLMNEFAKDFAIKEIVNSFLAMVKELEKYINIFLSIFSDLSDAEFKNKLISTIDSIRKTSNQIRQVVNDRILDHIDTNILAKNWASDFSDKYQEIVEEKIPLVMQLFRERQQALSERNSNE
jgi:truncated hemoglobin YjbI